MAEDTSTSPRFTRPAPVAHPHVALIGRTGSGKTALARAVVGSRRAPSVIGGAARYESETAPVIIDDLPGWAFGSERSVIALFGYLDRARANIIPVAAIWYTLDATSARITAGETQLIRRFAQRYPLVIALTRSDMVSGDALKALVATLEEAAIPNMLGIVAVAADPLPSLVGAPYGVAELIALTPNHASQLIEPAQPNVEERGYTGTGAKEKPETHSTPSGQGAASAVAAEASEPWASLPLIMAVVALVAAVAAIVTLFWLRRQRRPTPLQAE